MNMQGIVGQKRSMTKDMEMDEAEKRATLSGILQSIFIDVNTTAAPKSQGRRAQ